MPAGPLPDLPQIQLHHARPDSGLWRLARSDPALAAPYWAYPWSGGLALARYLLDHPQTAEGRRALDLGAGSGLVGIAAARCGAREVIAAETDPYAAVALELNAALNGLAISLMAGDVTLGPPPSVDLVLAGDVFYERELAGRVTAFLDRCVSAGIEVLVGDPGRAWLPIERLRRLADYPVADFGSPGGGTGSVFRLQVA